MAGFNSIRNVYSACCGRFLDPNYKAIIEKVETAWEELFVTDEVKITWTPKIHHIVHHFVDYFEDPLVEKTTDQIIEHCHSYINRMLTKSFYKLKNINTKNASKKQHNGILKINAFAVKKKI